MKTRAALMVVVVAGLVTFFLPLAQIKSPLAGTQRISGWDVVKPGEEKGRDNLGLNESLERMQRDVMGRRSTDEPLAIRQAQSLVVSLPLAYVALLAGGALGFLKKPRALLAAAGIGLAASVWSVISIGWLSSGVKEMVAASGSGRNPLLGLVTRSMADRVSVSAEWGLYLLAASLAVLAVLSFLRAK